VDFEVALEEALFRSEKDRNSAQFDEPAGIRVHHRSNYGTPGGRSMLIHGVAEKLPGFLSGTERQQHVAHHMPVRK
jgi:hypothetical protein